MFEKATFIHKDTRARLRPFEHRLLQVEQEVAFSFRRAISKSISWKKLVKLSFQVLMGLMRQTYSTSHRAAWIRTPPLVDMPRGDREVLTEGPRHPLIREYISLLLLRKLLGAMKQHVNARLLEINPLEIEEEEELFSELCETEQVEFSDVPFLIRNGYFPQNAPADNHLQLGETEVSGGRILYTNPETALLDCGHECKNKGVRVDKNQEGFVVHTTYCLICKVTLSEYISAKEKVSKDGCAHRCAKWVEGKEGSDAVCSSCGEPITNPGRFQWSSYGLEPLGDDPSQDEVIILDEVIHEVGEGI